MTLIYPVLQGRVGIVRGPVIPGASSEEVPFGARLTVPARSWPSERVGQWTSLTGPVGQSVGVIHRRLSSGDLVTEARGIGLVFCRPADVSFIRSHLHRLSVAYVSLLPTDPDTIQLDSTSVLHSGATTAARL